jgi:flagellar hook-basal body complex protein FliE
MTRSIGSDPNIARTLLEGAKIAASKQPGGDAKGLADDFRKKLLDRRVELESQLSTSQVGETSPSKFGEALQNLNQEVKKVDDLTESFLMGEKDFHEVAVQIRQSDLALKYAFAVRNKLVDAYREVMRMSV